jgi:hypothetical protein
VLPTTAANGVQILTGAAADSQNRVSYRLNLVNNQLPTSSFQTGTGISDVYQVMFSFRYTFN